MSSSVNYSTGCDGGGNKNSGKLAPLQAAECNVVLGLNMQYTESTYPIKKINFMSNTSLYHHPQHRNSIQFGGGPRLFDNSTVTSNQIAAGSCFKYPTGGEIEKMIFTASQLQEFEKQTMIYKHIISSIPVPPHLLVPLSTQSKRSDSEPWRCKRTDGKKWRCSRDVMPDQRYCERHAPKNRPRSRKPVETQSQNIKNLNSKHNYHSTLPPAPIPTSCQQSRCKEWFMKPMCSPSVESKRDHIFQNLEGNIQDLFERDSCSLTLMHPGGNDTFNDQDQDFFQMGIGMGMLNEDGSNSHNQWLNQGWWLGGPLGEALCSLNRPLNVSAPHDAGCGLH